MDGHFPESEKIGERVTCAEVPEVPQKQRIADSCQVSGSAPIFKNSEPEKMLFHTPSHSIPPLDPLLLTKVLTKKHMGVYSVEKNVQ